MEELFFGLVFCFFLLVDANIYRSLRLHTYTSVLSRMMCYVQSHPLVVVEGSTYRDVYSFARFSHAITVGVPDQCLFACGWFCIFCWEL